MKRIVVALLAIAGSAHADGGPPSPTLERAIKLYDKEDYLSSSIELEKVVLGESGDDAAGKQRAQFYLAKAHYQNGFPVAALAMLSTITHDAAHAYHLAAYRWIVPILDRVDASAGRAAIGPLTPAETDDPSIQKDADALRWYAGRGALDVHNTSGARAFFMRVTPASKFHAAAAAELAWLELETARATGDKAPHDGAADQLFARASHGDPTAIHRLGIWAWYLAVDPATHASYARVRGQLGELEKRDPVAAFVVSRLDVQAHRDTSPLGQVDDSVLAAAACGDLAELRAQIAAAANVDSAELPDKLTHPSPSLAALFDTPAIREARAWHAELAAELAHLYQADKAWQTTQVAAEVLQELTVADSIAQAELGKLLAAALANASPQLDVVAHLAGAIGRELTVRPGLCTPAPVVARETPKGSPPATQVQGCGGCASGGDAGLVLGALALRRRRATRSR